jgi:predicted MFS family arabinose efflux permease
VAAAAAEVAAPQVLPAGHTSAGGQGGTRATRRAVVVLAATQTVGYGALFYVYAVILTPMAATLHASRTAVAGALTCSLLAGAAAAIPVGRWLDRHGGRGLMTAGSVAASVLLVAASQVHSVAELYLAWIGIGVASAGVLYEAAFAVVIATRPGQPSGALLAVTIVAGFASTIFLPLAGYLTRAYDWRTALLILAAVYAAVSIPGHAALPRHRATPVRAGSAHRRDIVAAALRDPGYWALAVAFLASGAATNTVAVHLVAYLTELGHTATFAATTAGLIGVLSVTGRIATTASTRRLSPTSATAAVFTVQAASIAALPVLGHGRLGAIGCVLGFGFGFGVATIARPAILAGRYDTAAYATLAGILAVPLTIAKALVPLAAAALRDATGSYTATALTVAGLCALAATALLVTRAVPGRQPEA